jgi:predicted chitinase
MDSITSADGGQSFDVKYHIESKFGDGVTATPPTQPDLIIYWANRSTWSLQTRLLSIDPDHPELGGEAASGHSDAPVAANGNYEVHIPVSSAKPRPAGATHVIVFPGPLNHAPGSFDNRTSLANYLAAPAPAEPGPQPKLVEPQADGGLKVTYDLSAAMKDGEKHTIGIFWAKGAAGTDVLPNDRPSDALYTFDLPAKQAAGKYYFMVDADVMRTAPADAKNLLVVTDPDKHLNKDADKSFLFPANAYTGPLTAAQLVKVMPNVSAADAARYVGPLNAMMAEYGITTLEQRAAFLSQISVETGGLRTWIEDGGDQYFIDRYWLDRTEQWRKAKGSVGEFTPTQTGLDIDIPYSVKKGNAPANLTLDLVWSTGPAYEKNRPTLKTSVVFAADPKNPGHYKASVDLQNNVVPNHNLVYLLVVDPGTKKVFLGINNKIGNWSPQDAVNFRGRGLLQITGRYNYQEFADGTGNQEVMTQPQLLSDSTSNRLLGMESAGWYWRGGNPSGTDLNAVVSSMKGGTTDQLVDAVTPVINPGLMHRARRLSEYLRIRSTLLDPKF